MDESLLFGNPPEPQTLLITTHIGSSGRLFAGFRFWMDRHEAIEISYSYAPSDITVNRHCEHVDCGVVFSASAARANFLSANYVHAFRVNSRVRPFLTAGLGQVYFRTVAKSGPVSTPPNGTVELQMNSVFERNPFTFNVGGGLDVRMSRHWSVRLEYRDWMLEGPKQCDFDSCGATGLSDNQAPLAGLVFRF